MSKPFKWNEPSEKDIEDAVLQYLKFQVGVFAFKVDTRANFDPRLGTYRKLHGSVMPGTPDIIACVSVNGVGVFVGIEVKTSTGRQSKHQKEFQERLQDRANGFYFVVRTVKEAELAIRHVIDAVRMKGGTNA